MTEFSWGEGPATLYLTTDSDAPVRAASSQGDSTGAAGAPCPARSMIEILALGEGRALTNMRSDRGAVSERLRFVSSQESVRDGVEILEVTQGDLEGSVHATVSFSRFPGLAAWRVTTTVKNEGPDDLILQGVSTLALSGLSGFLGSADQTNVWTARSEWCGESRWIGEPITKAGGLVDIHSAVHGQAARGTLAVTSTSTWSSGTFVPVAALTNDHSGRAVAWQMEVSGPWRWELNTQYDHSDWLTLVLQGPNDLNHSWTQVLAPGQEFTTIPVSLAFSESSLDDAIGQLTEHRRRSHIAATADAGRPLIFNDYMNALMGDPTTEKLLPLIDAAAAVGADRFCIDAGWYDDGGDWWDSVGEWKPSSKRFGDLGLVGVLEYIRDKGMQPGLWIEAEVVGVNSPVADTLPDEAFMSRLGLRIVEHDRYFLDMRTEVARSHLNATFKRLINEYGARYFKWDYNVTPGVGPDTDASSPGEGLLEHIRAHLSWFEELRETYPDVIFEACSSGAQRMDQAILSRYDLQSTTDQQDYRLYPTIAAAAPMAMVPEQAGNWAYPQSEMTDEQIAFNLVTGLSGRLYLSGNLDRLSEHQLEIVRGATAVYPEVIDHHSHAVPAWPLGLPGWDDPVVSLATHTETETLVFVWNRASSKQGVSLSLPWLAENAITIQTVYPTLLPEWGTIWAPESSTLHINFNGTGEAARVFRLTTLAENG